MSLTTTAFDVALTSYIDPSPSVDLLADDTVTTKNLRDWIGDNVIFVLLVVAACVLGLGAIKSNFSKVLSVAALSIFGLAFFSLSQSQDAAMRVGNWFLSLLNINTGS